VSPIRLLAKDHTEGVCRYLIEVKITDKKLVPDNWVRINSTKFVSSHASSRYPLTRPSQELLPLPISWAAEEAC
jgi:hypothetical protein